MLATALFAAGCPSSEKAPAGAGKDPAIAEFGFRPGDPSVPVKSADQSNLWTKNADLGAQIEIPPVVNAPDGPVVRNLMTMWSRVMQK